MSIKYRWIAACAALLVTGPAAWSAEVGQAYVKGMGTLVVADSDREVRNGFAGVTVGFGYALDDYWNIELDLQAIGLAGKGGEPRQRQTALSVNVINIYNRGGLLSPYLLAGVGVVNTNISGERDRDNLQAQGGGGLIVPLLDDWLNLRAEGLWRWEDASAGSRSDFVLNVGLQVPFGGAR